MVGCGSLWYAVDSSVPLDAFTVPDQRDGGGDGVHVHLVCPFANQWNMRSLGKLFLTFRPNDAVVFDLPVEATCSGTGD